MRVTVSASARRPPPYLSDGFIFMKMVLNESMTLVVRIVCSEGLVEPALEMCSSNDDKRVCC